MSKSQFFYNKHLKKTVLNTGKPPYGGKRFDNFPKRSPPFGGLPVFK